MNAIMTPNDFIFSSKLKYRLTRHISLWIIFCVYFFVVNFTPKSAADFTTAQAYVIAFYKLMYIPVSILSAYITAYFLLPRFLLKGRYFSFVVLFIGLCGFNLFNAFWITKFYVLLTQQEAFSQVSIQIRIFQPIIYGLGLGTASGVFAGVARLLKIHYLEQKENERLEKLKITTELEIIKTHFHPHFLSQALQNISQLIRNHSPLAPEAILKLADLLSYFLYENEKERVPLGQETQMVHDYLELEKIFYGDRVVIHYNETGEKNNIYIAPLIIVAIVQHCCEQSLLSLQQKLVVDMTLRTQNNQLEFLLQCNGYYENINGTLQHHAGLRQVMKRVEVLYRGKHHMEMHLENGMFSFKLLLDTGNVPAMIINRAETKLTYEPA
ncbi:MAG TPA: histidine kinase [Chitinophagaceae bacterium]|nr:histidine kinase [Chitinophagaceae bacterium]